MTHTMCCGATYFVSVFLREQIPVLYNEHESEFGISKNRLIFGNILYFSDLLFQGIIAGMLASPVW